MNQNGVSEKAAVIRPTPDVQVTVDLSKRVVIFRWLPPLGIQQCELVLNVGALKSIIGQIVAAEGTSESQQLNKQRVVHVKES